MQADTEIVIQLSQGVNWGLEILICPRSHNCRMPEVQPKPIPGSTFVPRCHEEIKKKEQVCGGR